MWVSGTQLTDLNKRNQLLIIREYDGQEFVDFGYGESFEGWKNGFEYVIQNGAHWDVSIHSVFPLRNNEVMAVIGFNHCK